MDRLGDVLEVMHFSHRKYASVRASGVAHGRTWRMWWDGAGRIRTEEDRDGHHCHPRRDVVDLVAVRTGSDQWR